MTAQEPQKEGNRIKEWRPTLKQEQFLSLPDSIFEALFGGAAGGAKTESLLQLPLARGFHNFPRFRGILFRRTYPELHREIIERSFEWYPSTGAIYNTEKKQWQWPSRAIMRFGHMEFEKDARNYDTDEYNLIEFDELTSFTEFQYLYLFSRCRSSTNLPAIIRNATNPGNIGHAFVKDRFIEPGGKVVSPGTIIVDKKSGKKRIFIQSLLKDNPHLPADYYNTLSLLPDADRLAKRDGSWDSFAGQVFTDWRENRIPDEPANAVHVCEPRDIPAWWPHILAGDWGFAALTYFLWGALSPENILYVYREYAAQQAKISSWASEVARLSAGEKLDDIVLCASAWQSRGDEELIHEQFTRYSGLTPRPADNQRIAGKLAIQERLRWQSKPQKKVLPSETYSHEQALSIMRIKGLEAYKSYVKSFEPEEPETNLPKIQVTTNCPLLIKTVPLCIYAKPSNISGKLSEDVAEFKGDDPYDTLRYLVMAADGLSSNEAEAKHRQEVSQAILQLQRGGPAATTDYYRRMEILERTKPALRPARKMHRGSSW